jgi:antirestriction protein ArdC
MTVSEIITQRFIEELEKGIIPWQKPWSGGNRWAISHSTGKPYMILNQLLLEGGEYLTFAEVKKEGGKVKKGEKGSFCASWAKVQTTVTTTDEETGEQVEIKKTVPRLRYYYVFEVSQCEGIERKYTDEAKDYGTEHIADADNVIRAYVDREATLAFEEQEGGSRAYYSPSEDKVVVPAITQFVEAEEFYSTAFHELTHSTMHESRCNRQDERKGKKVAFGSEEYSKEELVAEIGAASLVNICGLETYKSFRNSAAYIQSWLKALKNDSNMIIGACARAEKAIHYILGTTEA